MVCDSCTVCWVLPIELYLFCCISDNPFYGICTAVADLDCVFVDYFVEWVILVEDCLYQR